MTRAPRSGYLVLGSLLLGGGAAAQGITVDGSLSAARTLTGPNYQIGAGLGQQRGGNLFHSFGRFSLQNGESATFTGPGSVTNVIGRVTGGEASRIDGTIRSAIAGSNLYLINPSGIVFGQNARVDVPGSFQASTANNIRFADGARFDATTPSGSTLTSAPIAAFGFVGANPASIQVEGATLSAGPGGTLGLVGGAVTVRGGSLKAPGGTVRVQATAGIGEVPHDPRGTPTARGGAVRIFGGALLDASDPTGARPPGGVVVRGGSVAVDGGTIAADNASSAAAGAIEIRADGGAVRLGGGAVRSAATGTGAGAPVTISAPGGLVRVAGATVRSSTNGAAPGGAIRLEGRQIVLAQGAAVRSAASGTGRGGNVTLAGHMISLGTGAKAGTGAAGTGRGGDLLVESDGEVQLTGEDTRLSVEATGSAGTGALALRAGALSLFSGAALGATAETGGRTGDVTIRLVGALRIEASTLANRIEGDGEAGGIDIAAGSVTLGNEGLIQLGLERGRVGRLRIATAGDIRLGAQDVLFGGDGIIYAAGEDIAGVELTGRNILVQGGSLFVGHNTAERRQVTIAARESFDGRSGLINATAQSDAGRAPDLTVSAREVRLGPSISVGNSSDQAGAAGDVTVTATEAIRLQGRDDVFFQAAIGSTSQGALPAGNVNVSAPLIEMTGNAGIVTRNFGTAPGARITLRAGAMEMRDGAYINAESFGTGQGGTVDLGVAGALRMSGTSDMRTVISSTASEAGGIGGDVQIRAGSLEMGAHAAIEALTSSTGAAGRLEVEVAGRLSMTGNGRIDSSSITSADATLTPGGAAGLVSVQAGELSMSGTARITSGTDNTGAGGSVAVRAGSATLTEEARITAATSGAGAGGAVDVETTGSLALSGAARIEASAMPGATGAAGQVRVRAEEVSVTGGAAVASSTAGPGAAGGVELRADRLILRDGGTLRADTTGAGAAGNVRVTLRLAEITSGGAILAQTSGAGAGGSVDLAAGGRLLIDGMGNRATGIFASSVGPEAGMGGQVRVQAGSVGLYGGARIASSTEGSAPGGRVEVASAGDVVIRGAGSEIAATSDGTGNAGSVLVSGINLLMSDGAAISTRALTANGGDITILFRDLIGMTRSNVITTVNGALGDGGNIFIDPRFIVMRGSTIQANAFGGRGGNIRIQVGQLVMSADSAITATSQLGIDGTVAISGPPLNLSGTFAVLPADLRAAAAVLRQSCALAGAATPPSLSLAPRGGRRAQPEATIPALYLADLPVAIADAPAEPGPQFATPALLTLSCAG